MQATNVNSRSGKKNLDDVTRSASNHKFASGGGEKHQKQLSTQEDPKAGYCFKLKLHSGLGKHRLGGRQKCEVRCSSAWQCCAPKAITAMVAGTTPHLPLCSETQVCEMTVKLMSM